MLHQCLQFAICRTSLRGSYSILRSRRSPTRTVALSWLYAATKGPKARHIRMTVLFDPVLPFVPPTATRFITPFHVPDAPVPLSLLGSGELSCFFSSCCLGIWRWFGKGRWFVGEQTVLRVMAVYCWSFQFVGYICVSDNRAITVSFYRALVFYMIWTGENGILWNIVRNSRCKF